MSRFEIGLPPGTFVFGAFVQIQKLSPRLLAVWRELFRRLPRARLAFSPLSPGAPPAYERMLEANGIDPAHALFIPQGGSDARNQARYLHADAVLDTFPYSGTNGTLEALCQGVPVVALEGELACERSTLTILVNAGLGELVAPTAEAYVELAVRLASEEGYRKSVRAAIDARLPGSVLADNAAHVRNLEAAWRQARAIEVVEQGVFEIDPSRDSPKYVAPYDLEGVTGMFRGTLRYPGWFATMKAAADLGLFEIDEQEWPQGTTYAQVLCRPLPASNAPLPQRVANFTGASTDSEVLARLEWAGLLSDRPIPERRASPLDIFGNRLMRLMMYQPGERDKVMLQHVFTVTYPDHSREEIRSTMVETGEPWGDTAMARTVA